MPWKTLKNFPMNQLPTIHFNRLEEYDMNSMKNNILVQDNNRFFLKSYIRKLIIFSTFLKFKQNTQKLSTFVKNRLKRHLLTKWQNKRYQNNKRK